MTMDNNTKTALRTELERLMKRADAIRLVLDDPEPRERERAPKAKGEAQASSTAQAPAQTPRGQPGRPKASWTPQAREEARKRMQAYWAAKKGAKSKQSAKRANGK